MHPWEQNWISRILPRQVTPQSEGCKLIDSTAVEQKSGGPGDAGLMGGDAPTSSQGMRFSQVLACNGQAWEDSVGYLSPRKVSRPWRRWHSILASRGHPLQGPVIPTL